MPKYTAKKGTAVSPAAGSAVWDYSLEQSGSEGAKRARLGWGRGYGRSLVKGLALSPSDSSQRWETWILHLLLGTYFSGACECVCA